MVALADVARATRDLVYQYEQQDDDANRYTVTGRDRATGERAIIEADLDHHTALNVTMALRREQWAEKHGL